MQHLQYPVGKFSYNPDVKDINPWIQSIKNFPSLVIKQIERMSDAQLKSTYRPDGWTAHQVIHHLADSHSHALLRFKTSLTEDKPTIKPYREAEYANLPDYSLPLDSAISILYGVHHKWSYLLENMTEADFHKGYFHPESGKFFSLHNALALYDWHCRHHFGHLEICANN